jgi:hypothetical protein
VSLEDISQDFTLAALLGDETPKSEADLLNQHSANKKRQLRRSAILLRNSSVLELGTRNGQGLPTDGTRTFDPIKPAGRRWDGRSQRRKFSSRDDERERLMHDLQENGLVHRFLEEWLRACRKDALAYKLAVLLIRTETVKDAPDVDFRDNRTLATILGCSLKEITNCKKQHARHFIASAKRVLGLEDSARRP